MFSFFSIKNGNPSEIEKVQHIHQFEEKGFKRDVSFHIYQEACFFKGQALGAEGASSAVTAQFVNPFSQQETVVKHILYAKCKDKVASLKEGKHEAKINKIIYGIGEIDEDELGFYILMKKLPSKTLRETYLYGSSKINSYRDFLKLFNSIIDNIKFIHDKGVIHKDIHEGNILIDEKTQETYLCDFGMATMISDIQSDPEKADVRELGLLIETFFSRNKLNALSFSEMKKLRELEAQCKAKYCDRISLQKVKMFCVDELKRLDSDNNSKCIIA